MKKFLVIFGVILLVTSFSVSAGALQFQLSSATITSYNVTPELIKV